MKLLMAAPFDANGRYKGGIGSVANTMLQHKDELDKYNLDVIKFNTCIVERPAGTDGKLDLANIKNSARLYTSIIKAIKKCAPDILYYHSSKGYALLRDLLVIRYAKRKTKTKTIIHIHAAEYSHIMTGKAYINNLIIRYLKKYVDNIVFLSKESAKNFESLGIDADKCSTIYNFSTLDTINDASEYSHRDESTIKLLFVGYIEQIKGIFDLADVVYRLRDENIELHVCGAPFNKNNEIYFDESRKKLGSKLIYHGYVSGDEKIPIYNEADILVLPSYAEGLPMVILEALATGCAVITTNVGAIPEIINEKNGIIVNPGDKKALEEAILTYVNDIPKLEATQKENIKYAEQFTCEEFIKNVSQVCKKVIS